MPRPYPSAFNLLCCSLHSILVAAAAIVIGTCPLLHTAGRDENALTDSARLKFAQGDSIVHSSDGHAESVCSFFAAVQKALCRGHDGFPLYASTCAGV